MHVFSISRSSWIYWKHFTSGIASFLYLDHHGHIFYFTVDILIPVNIAIFVIQIAILIQLQFISALILGGRVCARLCLCLVSACRLLAPLRTHLRAVFAKSCWRLAQVPVKPERLNCQMLVAHSTYWATPAHCAVIVLHSVNGFISPALWNVTGSIRKRPRSACLCASAGRPWTPGRFIVAYAPRCTHRHRFSGLLRRGGLNRSVLNKREVCADRWAGLPLPECSLLYIIMYILYI